MSPVEIAIMLDSLADCISERAAGNGHTRPALTGDQAVTVIIMALREMAEDLAAQ